MLTEAVRAFFQLPVGATAEQLLDSLDNQYDERLDGLLNSEESRNAARAFLAGAGVFTLSLSQQDVPVTRSSSITLVGCTDSILVGLFAEVPQAGLPTALESLLFSALLDEALPWHASLYSNIDRVAWREKIPGLAIIACPTSISSQADARRFIAALYGLNHVDLPKARSAGSTLLASPAVTVDLEAAGSTITKARLVAEAVSETHPKWRFLSFYRMVEHAYLSNIKRKLMLEFDRDAKAAVGAATKSLASEMNQLAALAEEHRLQAEFDAFNVELEALIAAGNQFAIKLDNGARDELMYGDRETFKKGVVRLYKLRCSIAHGGTSSLIYEDFSDANAATLALMESVIAIAMKSLKIRLIP